MMENTELLTELYATVNKILNIVTELKKNRPDANATPSDGSTVDLDLKADILSLKVGFEFYVQQMQLMVRTVSNLSPNFNFSLPDMTNLEDLYRKILNEIALINRDKASTKSVERLCEQIEAAVRSDMKKIESVLLAGFAELKTSVENFENSVLRNQRLRNRNHFWKALLAVSIAVMVTLSSDFWQYRRDSWKYRYLRAYNYGRDSMILLLDDVYDFHPCDSAIRKSKQIAREYETEAETVDYAGVNRRYQEAEASTEKQPQKR